MPQIRNPAQRITGVASGRPPRIGKFTAGSGLALRPPHITVSWQSDRYRAIQTARGETPVT